jgi:hypothetical protein
VGNTLFAILGIIKRIEIGSEEQGGRPAESRT